jgi:hypothetical protein
MEGELLKVGCMEECKQSFEFVRLWFLFVVILSEPEEPGCELIDQRDEKGV